MLNNTSGNFNYALGNQALEANSTGNRNLALGHQAGMNATGSSNIFIGYNAGLNATGSHKLYIHNSNADQNGALIYGEFDNKLVRTNGRIQILSDDASFNGMSSVKNYATNTFSDIAAILGENYVDDYYGIGVYGRGGYIGMQGVSNQSGPNTYYGVYGAANGVNTGTNYGVYGVANGGTTNFAGFFAGDVGTSGQIQLSSAGIEFNNEKVLDNATTLKYFICVAGAFPSAGGSNPGELIGEIKLMIPHGTLGGWLPCEGQLVSPATYPALFSLISTNYGGDGITSFGIPDMRHAVPVME
jgi:hypothetical protein